MLKDNRIYEELLEEKANFDEHHRKCMEAVEVYRKQCEQVEDALLSAGYGIKYAFDAELHGNGNGRYSIRQRIEIKVPDDKIISEFKDAEDLSIKAESSAMHLSTLVSKVGADVYFDRNQVFSGKGGAVVIEYTPKEK